MRAFTVDIETISGETGSSLDVNLSWASEGIDLGRSEARILGDIGFKGNISNVGGAYAITGKLSTELGLSCDRCLGEYSREMTIPFSRVFSEKIDNGFEKDEVDSMEGFIIDLGPHIREELILSLPIKLLCSEECKGLCADCGADLNKGACSCESKQ